MQVFVVFGTKPGQDIQEKIVKEFPDDHLRINEVTFLMACDGQTTKDVAGRLGMNDDSKEILGIVVPINSYWGRHDMSTWEWIAVKGQT